LHNEEDNDKHKAAEVVQVKKQTGRENGSELPKEKTDQR
jgi:hypothetical protein